MAADERDEEDDYGPLTPEQAANPDWEQPANTDESGELYRRVEFTYDDGSKSTLTNITTDMKGIISEARMHNGWMVGNNTAINLRYVRRMLVTAVFDTKQDTFKPEQRRNLR